MSWVQTAYLIAEVIAIPLTGLLTRALTMRWLFVAALARLHARLDRLRRERRASRALVAWRVLQGFAGGTLIPAVFSAVFLLFPERRQALATTLAGVARRARADRSARSSAAGSPRPIPGTGCSSSTSLPGLAAIADGAAS